MSVGYDENCVTVVGLLLSRERSQKVERTPLGDRSMAASRQGPSRRG